ncbi:MAG: hypothetical protein Q4G68_09745 [Planctomycetia bacterium]|nr:hypothetical protein [Planctomycetia bacterium]
MEQEQNTSSLFSKKWNMADESSSEDQPLTNISVLAILCLLGGLLSFLLYFSVYFCFVPVATFLLALLTLYRIKRSEGILVGAWMAWAGIFLLLIPCVAVPVQTSVFRARLCADSCEYLQTWFRMAKEGNYEKIRQMQHVPHFVQSKMSSVNYWKQFTREEESHAAMHSFLKNKLLLTLATLGDRAEIAPYRIDAAYHTSSSDKVLSTWSVTYPNEAGQKETFFLRIDSNRTWDEDKQIAGWTGGGNVTGPLKLDESGRVPETLEQSKK